MIKQMKVDIDFYNLVNKFRDDFKKLNGIDISYPKATRIIATKIKRLGGLVVD